MGTYNLICGHVAYTFAINPLHTPLRMKLKLALKAMPSYKTKNLSFHAPGLDMLDFNAFLHWLNASYFDLEQLFNCRFRYDISVILPRSLLQYSWCITPWPLFAVKSLLFPVAFPFKLRAMLHWRRFRHVAWIDERLFKLVIHLPSPHRIAAKKSPYEPDIPPDVGVHHTADTWRYMHIMVHMLAHCMIRPVAAPYWIREGFACRAGEMLHGKLDVPSLHRHASRPGPPESYDVLDSQCYFTILYIESLIPDFMFQLAQGTRSSVALLLHELAKSQGIANADLFHHCLQKGLDLYKTRHPDKVKSQSLAG